MAAKLRTFWPTSQRFISDVGADLDNSPDGRSPGWRAEERFPPVLLLSLSELAVGRILTPCMPSMPSTSSDVRCCPDHVKTMVFSSTDIFKRIPKFFCVAYTVAYIVHGRTSDNHGRHGFEDQRRSLLQADGPGVVIEVTSGNVITSSGVGYLLKASSLTSSHASLVVF
jgi:hypothetical protein